MLGRVEFEYKAWEAADGDEANCATVLLLYVNATCTLSAV